MNNSTEFYKFANQTNELTHNYTNMNGKYWNEEIETMPRKQLEKLQVERLKKTVEIAMGSEFYAPKFKELGITPESIKSVEDIKRFPFTTKNDLRAT